MPHITYYQETDTLQGMCGLKGDNHQCLEELEVLVGEGVEGYNTMVNVFDNYAAAPYASAVLLNALHPDILY